MEPAPRGRIDKTGHLSGNISDIPFWIGKALKKFPGVRVARLAENNFRRCILHVLSGIHDHDSLADLAGDTQIMGNEKNRDAPVQNQPRHQFENLSLHRHIQSGRGFICN